MSSNRPHSPLFSDESAAAFRHFRKPPDSVLSLYMSRISTLMSWMGPRPDSIIDIGCGPGHFAIPLAKAVEPFGGRVTAIDSSRAMISLLQLELTTLSITNVESVLGDFMELDQGRDYSIFWLSDVLHLLSDREGALAKIRSLSQSSSGIAIRMSSHEQLRSYEWTRYFPEALTIDLSRHPDISEVKAQLIDHKFESIEVLEIDETRTVETEEYLMYFESKYISSLRLVSDALRPN